MNEYETRSEHITPALKAAGWGVVDGSKIEYEYPITNGRIMGAGKPKGPKLIADYVLVYKNHKLAVVEAKAWDEALTEGVGQAKEYAGKMKVRFAYASNGQGVYPIDMETAAEGPGGPLAFPTPEELWAKTFPPRATDQATTAAWRERFAAVPYPDKSKTWSLRFYQEIAVNRVLERIAEGRDRALLLERFAKAQASSGGGWGGQSSRKPTERVPWALGGGGAGAGGTVGGVVSGVFGEGFVGG